MSTYSFVESAGVGSSLHELPNARPVHMAELRRFLAFSKRREKRSRGIRSKTGGEKPLVDGFPGLRVNGHVVDFAAFFAKAKPTLPFPLVNKKPNGGKVLPLGSDTAWVALLLGGALATGQNDMV
jgi:hypothetical protein